jgi:hypothetical protein
MTPVALFLIEKIHSNRSGNLWEDALRSPDSTLFTGLHLAGDEDCMPFCTNTTRKYSRAKDQEIKNAYISVTLHLQLSVDNTYIEHVEHIEHVKHFQNQKRFHSWISSHFLTHLLTGSASENTTTSRSTLGWNEKNRAGRHFWDHMLHWDNSNKEYMKSGTNCHGITRTCGTTWSGTTWNFRNYRCWTTWELTNKHSTVKNTFSQSLQGMSLSVLPRSVASWADGSSNTKPILGETSRQPLKRDSVTSFLIQDFFMNHLFPSPKNNNTVIVWKLAEIFASQGAPLVSTTRVTNFPPL